MRLTPSIAIACRDSWEHVATSHHIVASSRSPTADIVVPSRSLSANHSYIAITFRDVRYHRDRYLQTAASLQSHFASRGTFVIAHGESQLHRNHLTDRGTIATAISESRLHCNHILRIAVSSRPRSANRCIIAIALAIRDNRAIALANG